MADTKLQAVVRQIMATGLAAGVDLARSGEADISGNVPDLFGTYPAEFLQIRPSIVDDLVEALAEERPQPRPSLEQATDAAAKALHERIQSAYDVTSSPIDRTRVTWDELRPLDRLALREQVLPIVTAALAAIGAL